jgi:HSP20 family molecular chaperone IbpA
MSDKIKVMPCACFSHDEEGGRLRIDMEMTEVDKKDINLEMRKDTFCVSAPRGQETEYAGCFKLSHEILPEKAEAKYDSGTLTIFAPIKDWGRKVNVTVQ